MCIAACTVKSDQVFPDDSKNAANAKKASGDVYCSTITIDWWNVVCTNNGQSCTWTYMYPETKTDCSYINGSPATGLGGGGIWFDGLLVPAADGRLQDITNSSTLNSNETTELREALNDFIAYCLQNNVFSQLVARGKKFNFVMNPNQSGLAGFNPNNNQLSFQSMNQINEYNLREELYHGYQDIFYSGGISQYTGQQGEANIEFEAKLFKDLVGAVEFHPGGLAAVPFGNPKHDEYQSWIASMTNYSKYPTELDLTKYFYFLDAFKQSYPTHNTATKPDLLPNALLQLIKGSICPK